MNPELPMSDSLGLARSALAERLDVAIARATRFGGRTAALMLDIEPLGGEASLGSHEPLALLGPTGPVRAALEECVRRVDFLAQVGPTRFGVVKTDLLLAEHADTMARRLIEAATQALGDAAPGYRLRCGIAIFPPGRADSDTLLAQAQSALGQAETVPRFFDEAVHREVSRRSDLAATLEGARERSELLLELQPQVDLLDRRVDAVEALLRWRHPEFGLLVPARFLGVAESRQILPELGAWVLAEACRLARHWRESRLMPVPIAVNLATSQLDPELPRWIAELLAETGVAPPMLELEVTEDQVALCGCETVLESLAELGVRLTVDDYGSGRSSLAQLHRLRFHKLKLDPALTRNLPDDPDASALLRAMVAMARALGMEVAAEGIEREEQIQPLIDAGCTQGLGRLLGPPQPIEELLAGLDASGRPRAATN